MSDGRFTDRIAVVVGGGNGIGRATALRLAREGATVRIADADPAAAAEVAAEARTAGGVAESAELDARDPEAVGGFFAGILERDGRLDALVNCPGQATPAPFEDVTLAQWDADVAVTLTIPFLCIQAALPALLAAGHGAVVSIGSVNGLQAFGNEAYGAAKAGLVNLHQNLALRYGPRGLRFNVVAPGTVRTRVWERQLPDDPHLLDEIALLYPLRRVGLPDDIAAACAFLASDDAAWITGTVLTVDGGITAGHGRFLRAASRDDDD